MKKLTGIIAAIVCIVQISQAQSINGIKNAVQQMVANVSTKVNVAINSRSQTNQWSVIGDDEEPMRTKTVTKSFSVDNSDKISIANQYGSIQIKVWGRKEIKADIDIRAYSDNEDEAQKLLDEVSIDAGKSGDQVSFKTRMDQRGGNWGSGSRHGKKWRREVRINYVVYMPVANALTLSQTYGNVTMGDLSGPLYAKVQYGNFIAANLSHSNNYIDVQYGTAKISNINKATIKQKYGAGLTIGTVGTLNLDAEYAGVNITTITGSATIKQKYGSGLIIGTAASLGVDIEYAKVVLGTLKGNGEFDLRYSKLNINEIATGCRVLNVEGQYTDMLIGFSNGYQADFTVHSSYGSFKYGENVSAKNMGNDKSYTTKNYIGKIGNGGAATVKISSAYGGITFK